MVKDKDKKIDKTEIKSWIKIVCFILVFLVALQALSATVFSKKYSSRYKNIFRKAFEYVNEVEDTVDVVVIGNSNAYSSFCPLYLWKDYGYTSSVISAPKQTVNFSYVIFQDFIEKQNPKVLILEAEMFYSKKLRDADLVDKEEYLESYNSDEFNIINKIPTDLLTNKISNELPIFLTHDSWKRFNDIFSKKPSVYADGIFHHGYYYRTSVVKVSGKNHMKYTDKYEIIDEKDIELIKKIKKLCDKEGIELMIYNAPTTTSWSYARHNGVQELADSLGVQYIDFNALDDYKIDYAKDFADKGNHQNYNGAKKITKYVGDFLLNNRKELLVDKRDDANYDYMDENAEQFFDKVRKDKK